MIDPADGDNTAHELQNISKLKLPPFWPSNPDIWFRQDEAQFTLTRISSEKTKFNILLANLPTEIISTVVDLIQNPPDINPYSSLKKLLIDRLSLSEEKRLDDVLLGSQMGDQKPSDFYRAMLTTVGGSQVVSPNLLLKLWQRRLPRVVSVALLASGKEDVVDILSIADKVWESMNLTSTSTHLSEVQKHRTTKTPPHDELLTTIQNLTLTCQALVATITQQQQDNRTKNLENQINSLTKKISKHTNKYVEEL
ncbi:uncharacterized protein [Onthophagus taurus]|uniref:uncharacterized protein n=1 Tax=Onthophagus taurus TaxID=166361 RepID=UPI0039BE22D0